jgi:hypothetical protein
MPRSERCDRRCKRRTPGLKLPQEAKKKAAAAHSGLLRADVQERAAARSRRFNIRAVATSGLWSEPGSQPCGRFSRAFCSFDVSHLGWVGAAELSGSLAGRLDLEFAPPGSLSARTGSGPSNGLIILVLSPHQSARSLTNFKGH